MKMPGQVWLTLLLLVISGWCGSDNHAPGNSHTEKNATAQATSATISLDFTPMTDPTSTFVSITTDNKAKAVRYSRSLLVVKSLAEGTLSRQDAASLFDKVRALTCGQSFGTPGLARGDQFTLTVNVDQKQTECVGFVEDAPPNIRSLVTDVLSTSKNVNSVALAEAYVRSEPISTNRYEALRKSPSLRFINLENFSNDAQQVLSTAINHPRDFVMLNSETRQNLSERIVQGQELFITHKGSGHQLTIFRAQR
jgi:hypothetical protein